MATTNSVPKPANQGGHASAPTQVPSVQKKSGPVKPGNSSVLNGYHTAGVGGKGTTTNKVKKG